MAEKNSSKSGRSRVFLLAIGAMILGAIVVPPLIRILPGFDAIKPRAPWDPFLYLALALLMAIPAIATHELGHLITGLISGFSFSLFVVGPLGIRRNDSGNIEAYFNRDLMSYGGLAAALPTNSENLRSRFARYVAAGPLTSLVVGAVSLLIFGAFGQSEELSTFGRYALLMLMSYGLMNLGLFLATTLPSRTGPYFTDRARLMRLLSDTPESKEEIAMLSAMAHLTAGKDPADLSHETIRNLVVTPTDPGIASHYFAYLACLARGEFKSVGPLLDRIAVQANELAEPLKSNYLVEAAFGHAVVTKDKKKTLALWNKVSDARQAKEDCPVLRTKHAMAWLWGEREMEQRLAGLRAKANKLGPMYRASELALIQALEQEVAKSEEAAAQS